MLAVSAKKVTLVAKKQIHGYEITHTLLVVDEANTKKAFPASGYSPAYWFRRRTYDRPA